MYPEFGALGTSGGRQPSVGAGSRPAGGLAAVVCDYSGGTGPAGLDLDSKEVHGIRPRVRVCSVDSPASPAGTLSGGPVGRRPGRAGKRLGVFVDGWCLKIRTATWHNQQGRGKHKTCAGVLSLRLARAETVDRRRTGRAGPPGAWEQARAGRHVRGADEVMELLAMYLHLLGAASARLVVLGADGAATWVWERWGLGQPTSGIEEASRVTKTLDWCLVVHPLIGWQTRNTWSDPDVRAACSRSCGSGAELSKGSGGSVWS